MRAAQVPGTATTGSDGTYQINDLAPGSYQVCFTPDNTAAGTPPTGYAGACHTGNVTVTDGHTTAGVNGALPVGAAVSGRVTAAADGTVISERRVRSATPERPDVFGPTTAADGTYRVIGLTGGTTVTVCFDGRRDRRAVGSRIPPRLLPQRRRDPPDARHRHRRIDHDWHRRRPRLRRRHQRHRARRDRGRRRHRRDVYSADDSLHRGRIRATVRTRSPECCRVRTQCVSTTTRKWVAPLPDQCYHDPVAVTAGVTTENIDASLTPL